MDDIIVKILDLPYDVDGICRLNEDGTFTIVLNARCSYEAQKEAYEHEMRHIRNGDHYRFNVNEIEYENRQ